VRSTDSGSTAPACHIKKVIAFWNGFDPNFLYSTKNLPALLRLSLVGGRDRRTMTRAAAPPILLQLHCAESVSSQIIALRTLKNELIGHDQRKESYIADGIIPALAQVLTTGWPGAAEYIELSIQDRATLAENYEACLQATLIVGSLVQGAHQFSGREPSTNG
jgi:hypothetical protein